MAIHPGQSKGIDAGLTLRSFESADADQMAAWGFNAQDAEWVAPRTRPPITAEKILRWHGVGKRPFTMINVAGEMVGYGELNVLSPRRASYWLGHLLVNPDLRGKGFGRTLVRLLMQKAFSLHAAKRVTLVVFPENNAAISAYKAAGMKFDGYETHFFAPYNREVQLVRMDCRGL